ncbi:hypothetical protein [Lihuaxuella thermophila]|uniref:Uncharacterized protein n=1 Tax=Lihuaxuella thermophila TaxID=1173111 RepID=A0A1H8HA99_9BACL|nr:hypothetical protein [Lihuaxuella thermophila]SEN53085.1 hypothetical protein SAMN05444955_113111 [Lihuaxuella thermophila]
MAISLPQRKSGIEPREFQFGNTTVRIHSKLAWMTEEEQRAWYKEQWQKGNPILQRIAEAMFE